MSKEPGKSDNSGTSSSFGLVLTHHGIWPAIQHPWFSILLLSHGSASPYLPQGCMGDTKVPVLLRGRVLIILLHLSEPLTSLPKCLAGIDLWLLAYHSEQNKHHPPPQQGEGSGEQGDKPKPKIAWDGMWCQLGSRSW